MKKITLLFALLSCWFGSAQIIEFENIIFKNYLLSANSTTNLIASTETATFNLEAAREYSTSFVWNSFIDTSVIFQVQNYYAIDSNSDGEIDINEAEAITYLNLDGFDFDDPNLPVGESSATDLQYFTNLKFLGLSNANSSSNYDFDLSFNPDLEMLNISKSFDSINIAGLNILQNTALTHLIAFRSDDINGFEFILSNFNNLVFLNINYTYIDSLNITQLPALQELYYQLDDIITVSSNYIDFTQNLALKRLFIDTIQILSLDLSQNSLLTHLKCTNNSIGSLDVSQNPLLTYLNCYSSEIYSLNITGCDLLEELNISFNFLVDLDVSECPNLTKLNASYTDELQYLNLKNNNSNWSSDDSLILNTTPSLMYVCANEENISYVQSKVNETTNVNSYCSFGLGGDSYDLQGAVKISNDEVNCETSEVAYPFLKINISNETDEGFYFANQDGFYTISVGSGSHTLTPELENPDYFNVSPSSITVEFPATESPFEQHFCVTPNGIYHDLEVTIVPLGNAVPGFDASYKILYKNKGNQPENPNLTFTYDDAVLDFLSSSVVPNNTMSGLLSWNLEPLNVFESGFIIVNFNLNTPMETPPLNSDDVLSFQSLIIVGDLPDVNPEDNNFTLNQLVVNSYDPNDKTCLEGQSIHPDMIGEFLHYRIRFENTGTFPAQNVVIKDMIDEEKFDIATLQMVDASHDCRTRIAGQKVEFIFEDIQLDFNDATNDGYVVFKIKTLPTLTLNSTISNTAEIYFDFNFPIITNTETSTFEIILSNENFTFENELILHPNPAKNQLSLTSVNGILIQDIEIYNLQGQKVMEVKNASENLDVSGLQAGTYLIKVFTNQGSSHAKFIKE
uniref:DUF7619 domain-containing protein n=1 Tax=Flavobacterium sp. TaxID=239 RepID=UPI00404AF9E6